MKKLKKNFLVVLSTLLLLCLISSCRDECTSHIDSNNDGICDNCHTRFKEQKPKVICIKCNGENESDALYCNHCGANLMQHKVCPTCGNETGSEKDFCEKCGTELEIKCMHVYGNPTCNEPAICTKCDQIIIDALGHIYDNDCDNTCNLCNETRENDHSWLEANCNSPKTCSKCGETVGDKLGHLYDNECDSICNRCGEKVGEDHIYKNATCTTPKTCIKCGETIGDKLGHLYTNDCDSYCNRCGYYRIISHSWNPATYTTPKTCSKCGATEGSPLTCTSHTDTNSDNLCDRCGKTIIVITEYKPKWEPNQQTNGWNGDGMTVKILVQNKYLYDPFDPGYTGTNKKIMQRQVRNIEKSYGVDLVFEEYVKEAVWGPCRVEYIKTKTNSGDFAADDVYVVNIESSWIPTLVKSGCLAELATLDNEWNAESGIFTEIGYQETYVESGEYVQGTYLQHPANNQVASSMGKVYGYVNGNVRPDYFMYYNADMIAETGMTDPAELWFRGEWTWSKFEYYVADLQAALGDGKYALSVGFPEFIIGSTASTGSKIATIKPFLGLTSTAVFERFRAIQRLYVSGCYEKRNVEDVSSGFLEKNVAIVHGELWFIGDETRFDPAVCDFTIGAVPYPTADNEGGVTQITFDPNEAIIGYDGEAIEVKEGTGEYISGVDMSGSSFAVSYCSTECYSIIDTSNGKNGINNKIIFAILYDLYDGLGLDPEKAKVDSETAYRNWLLTKFDRELYADVIMSVQDCAYFELIELVSMTVGGGSHFGPNAFWPLAATICRDASISPATKLNEVVKDYKDAMRAMGYNLPY